MKLPYSIFNSTIESLTGEQIESTAAKVVSIIETSHRVYRLTFNGRLQGDSPGFSLEGARAEAVARVNEERRWAARDKRSIELTLGDLTGDVKLITLQEVCFY